MTSVSMFVIRHKPTGFTLPAPIGRNGKGGSHVEPVDPAISPPRLFTKERSAQIALQTWLKGKFVRKVRTSFDEFDDDEDIMVEYQPHRKAGEMEVTAVTIIIP